MSFLSNCKIADEKREVEQNDAVLVSYLFSNQYAITEPAYKNHFSHLYAGVAAANPETSATYWIKPPSGCNFTQLISEKQTTSLGLRRLIDAGELRIEDKSSKKYPLKFNSLKSLDSYSLSTVFAPANYKLYSPGVENGALKFTQNFKVLGLGSELTLHNFDRSNNLIASTPLASPQIPAPEDASFRLIFDRQSHNVISFNAPAGTSYVKLRLRDGSNLPEGDITCFSKPNDFMVVHIGALNTFRITEQAFMELDFVNSNEITDVNRLKRGIIVSTTRHIQGTFELRDTEGNKHTRFIGLVEIQ